MESITIHVAPEIASAYRAASDDERKRIDSIIESRLRDLTAAARLTELPEWCNVYSGMTDEEIDDIESAIVRDPGTRRFG
jgi:hypothetical protein